MTAGMTKIEGLRGIPWRISYRTSSVYQDGGPVDILHDFYIPALRHSVRYDRMAGYFRSTSLAAASQGFSAFVGREGKMRLIVGADLDLEDVGAILQGTEDRLATSLNAQLENSHEWPEQVTRGVELLAWMVAKGYIEVRVAFRVHTQTGEIMDLDAVEDGYVHMKWAVFTDAQDNHMYISGSLNESRTSLTLNAENIDVHCDWRGETESQRVIEAIQEFQNLWDDQNPALRVLTLPEAVNKRLIKFAEGVKRPLEIDGTSAAPREVSPPSTMERLRFALLRDGPKLPGGRYVGMETVPITPWPHQEIVARRLIDTWPSSYLLCDEVGLGKTIEAGLAIRSLYLSGLAKRILICPPASLTRQWHREMADKFFLPFGRALPGSNIRHEYLLPFEEYRPSTSIYEPDLAIVSTGLLARGDRSRELKAAKDFDIALVDEAHYARRKNPTQGTQGHPQYSNLYKTMQQNLCPKSRSLLLATATPMQLDPVEAADLIQLTDRVGAFQFDPSLTRAYYNILDGLVSGQEISQNEWQFLRRSVLSIENQDPLFWHFVQQAVIDGRTRLPIRQWLERGRIPRKADLKGIQRLIFTASPLSRVMLRHTRSLLEIYHDEGQLGSTLAKRRILPVPGIVFNDMERQAYNELESYCRGLADQIGERGGTRSQTAVGFYLSFLRLRFASSLFAIRETLRRRLERVDATMQMQEAEDRLENEEFDLGDILDEGDDDTEIVRTFLKDRETEDLKWEREQLKSMLNTFSDLSGHSSKMTELFKLLTRRRISHTGRIQQTVIFTRFYDTLSDIVDRLLRADPKMLIGTYSGRGGQYLDARTCRIVGVERDEVKQRFLRGEIDVLVCTDAAAEGLNLQTADFLVNFDLPWNPMKVEQRIGRIDRIGQKHETVYVLNLCYVDSVEQIVYDRLLRRLSNVMAVVGTQQISLLPVTREEFQQLAERTLTEAELEKRAIERAKLARKRTASMEIPARDLYAMYLRFSEQSGKVQLPVDLGSIWESLIRSTYLHDLGCRVLPDTEQKVMTLAGIPDLPDGTAVTISRSTYEIGVPHLKGRLHFASYGDPAFQSILDLFMEFTLPDCIRRIEVENPDLSAKIVSYAIACIDDEGQATCKLVNSLNDLDDLQIDDERTLLDEDIEALRRSLEEIARKEFSATRAVPRIEELNKTAGRSQLFLDFLVVKDLILGYQVGENADQPFWQMASRLEEIYQDRELIRTRIPIDHARKLTDPLFDIVVPTTSEYAYLDATQPLLMTSIEAAYRLANAMKVKRSELSTNDFMARLDREIEKVKI